MDKTESEHKCKFKPVKFMLIGFNIILLLVSGYLSYTILIKPKPDVEIVYIKLPDQRVDWCVDKIGVLESNFISLLDVYWQRNKHSLTKNQLSQIVKLRKCYSTGSAQKYYNSLIEGLGGDD